ncbi:phage tail protein [Alloalcanivorax xenomutans]|uniref:phage tail protein n=1 Tax=Alloalcanivorax xenomutans TaxID=1094342 RepID=UPI00047A3379
MSEPYVGEIRMFAGHFAPTNWAFCDGQLMSIADNAALFSILGTIYGGDGRITFALPDLRGHSPAHAGQGPGLTQRHLGERTDFSTVTVLTSVQAERGLGLNPSAPFQAQPRSPYLAVNFIIALNGIYPSPAD